jgi:hypothetical protein
MPPGSPFGASVQAMLAYLHHHHAIAYNRLCRLMTGNAKRFQHTEHNGSYISGV